MKKKSKILFFMFLCLFSIGFGNKAFASATTWNPSDKSNNVVLSNNNLTATYNSTNGYVKATEGITVGKKYFEVTIDSAGSNGLTIGATYDTSGFSYNTPVGYYYQGYTYTSATNRSKPFTTNDVIGVAIDLDSTTKTVSFYLNGVFVATENIPNYVGQTIYPFINQYYYTPVPSCTANFGATAFKYHIPNGFLAYNNELVSNITLNKATDSLQEGQTDNLIATTTPADAEVAWTSSDDTVAKVKDGKVTGRKEGKATITAQIKGTDIKATCEVTVTKDVIEPEEPTGDGNLYIEMVDGNIKSADKNQIDKFKSWFIGRDLDKTENPIFKITNAKGNIEYLVHDKIVGFEVR